ncbi:MAG TPA: hypothetical protein DFR83_15875, partial [Deltaproteobacteria bacterium]|nr:hypothetical protein [Deltaproteobacteria bacterium]
MDWKQVVELTAIIIAAWAVWLSLPRSPSLDWQRLFKVTISVGLWAEIEASQDHQGASEGVESEWRRLLSECLPFHPAGRSWREKVVNPVEYIPPVPALPGERGLLEALAALETKQERWDRLFGARAHEVDVAVADALGDPRELGAEYDPRRLLGPEADWAGVAAWSEPVRSGLTRRLQHVILLEIGLAEGLSPGAEVPDVRRHVAPGVGDGPDGGWEALCEAPSDRFVVVLHGALLRPWLTCMTQSPALVDRIVGVVV